jgi:lipopolysaccharide transport system permease protein
MQRPTPLSVLAPLVHHRLLVVEMTRREILIKTRGSVGGVLWSLLQPLLLLSIFALVFGEILRTKWAAAGDTRGFVLFLFSGLIVFNLFGDSLQSAPGLLLNRPNLVKKVVFPLETLAWVHVLQALWTFALSLVVLLGFLLVLRGGVPWTAIFVPVVVLPVVLASLAVSWFVGALAVFVRDVAQVVGPLVTALLFLSPVFFDLNAVPERFRPLFAVNPLSPSIEQMRAILLDGRPPDATQLAVGIAVSFCLAWGALWFFCRAREDVADAL